MSMFPNPYDGFRPDYFESALHNKYELYIDLFGGGNRIAQRLIRSFPLTPDGRALCEQHFYALQSICRFMNSGGDPASIYQMIADVMIFVEDRPVELPEPWSLLHTLLEVEDPTVVFINNRTGNCLVVRENESTEEMTAPELLEQIDARDHNESTRDTDSQLASGIESQKEDTR